MIAEVRPDSIAASKSSGKTPNSKGISSPLKIKGML